MMEISKLYFGRVWTVHEYCGNCIFHASSVDKKYRVLKIILYFYKINLQ